MIYDYLIIGAGLSGLSLANKISSSGKGSVLVLEKSRGVGGRMATRRTLDTRFDHGAQFYKLKEDSRTLHQEWINQGISKFWFHEDQFDHWNAPEGMTALAKNLAKNVNVLLEKQIKSVQFDRGAWKLTSDKNEAWICHHLIISSPLPQTIKLIEEIPKNLINEAQLAHISSIHYTKALIALVTLKEAFDLNSNGYLEFKEGPFFSLADQHKKQVSTKPAFTLTMSPEFSEHWFDLPEENTLEEILKILKSSYPQIEIFAAELKKWRYCKPLTQYQALYLEIAPKLFLIGDAFGGSSLLGAIRSSSALAQELIK